MPESNRVIIIRVSQRLRLLVESLFGPKVYRVPTSINTREVEGETVWRKDTYAFGATNPSGMPKRVP